MPRINTRDRQSLGADLKSNLTLSRLEARTMMLAAQGLHRRPDKKAARADVLRAIRRMGALQIDTIHVIARSPYLVLWSRLGHYEPHWLDELLARGSIFEYWSHEACFLPIEDYPLYRHRMLNAESMGWKYRKSWVDSHRNEVDLLLKLVRERGAVRSSDFERTDGKPAGWWEWKSEKLAMEALFTAGELMIARRENFHRVYDLRERVLPSWDDGRLPPFMVAQRKLILKAIRSLGVAKAGWVNDYFRMPKRETIDTVLALADEGALLRVAVEGWKEPAFVHPENRKLLWDTISGKTRPELTTLLSPFDPLVWDRARLRVMFDFNYGLECYTPAPKRKYGYYVLPILHQGALIGRLDAKAHRKDGVFEVKSIHQEPKIRVDEEMIIAVATAIRDCGLWHKTPKVVIRKSEPGAFGKRLLKAVIKQIQDLGSID
jgi:uncharacterized protein YcaQ